MPHVESSLNVCAARWYEQDICLYNLYNNYAIQCTLSNVLQWPTPFDRPLTMDIVACAEVVSSCAVAFFLELFHVAYFTCWPLTLYTVACTAVVSAVSFSLEQSELIYVAYSIGTTTHNAHCRLCCRWVCVCSFIFPGTDYSAPHMYACISLYLVINT